MIREVNAICRRVDVAARLPDDHDTGRGQRVAKFLNDRVRERLAVAARKRMKKNERRIFIKMWERIPRRERAAKPLANRRASTFRQFKITVNGMPITIDLCDAIVEQA